MAFPPSITGAKVSAATAVATATAPATTQNAPALAVETPAASVPTVTPTVGIPVSIPATQPAPAATVAGKKQVTDLHDDYNRALFDLSNAGITEATDLTLGSLAGPYEELGKGIRAIAQFMGLGPTDDSVALRFMPERVTEAKDGEESKTLSARLYLFSLNQSAEGGTCVFNWNKESVTLAPDEHIVAHGIRIDADGDHIIRAADYVLPLAAFPASGISKDDRKKMVYQQTYGELSEFLAVGNTGGDILSDVPEGFRLFVSEIETRTSKAEKEYALVCGLELDEQSQAKGEVKIFSPVSADQWEGYTGNTHVLIKVGKEYQIFSAADGSKVTSFAIQGETYKLKDLEIGQSYDMVGIRQITLKDQSTSWVVDLRKQGQSEVKSYWSNTTIRNAIANGAKKILASCEQLPADKSTDGITNLSCLDKPFAVMTVTNMRPAGSGTAVDMRIVYRETAESKEMQTNRLAALGIKPVS